MAETIYLDNNATTKVAPEVLEEMMPFLRDRYGNPSSIHRFGGLVRSHIDRAREQVAALLGAHPDEITFTGCGSESDNLAIQGFYRRHGSATNIVTSMVEHPAVRSLCRFLRDHDGVELTEINVDHEGLLREDEFSRAKIGPHTLVTLMWANNETGVLFPIKKLAETVKAAGGFFHTDAVQAVGKVPINCAGDPVDMLALAGHKLHAPKGVGALYIRKGVKISPLIIGGHQENGLRAGTENVAAIVGLGKACAMAQACFMEEATRVKNMRDRLERALLTSCRDAKRNGHEGLRLPNTCNISFEFIEGEAILLLLDEKNIAASSGSACTTGSLEPSHVMRAMGLPYTLAHSSTRFSLSRYTTEAEIDAVVRALPPIIERLREISPYSNPAGPQ
ncbi:MAG: cysteine desulfurase NifS [Chitinivibrionales bacterium]|nr:cysteine desulfurase NifS [Chitinivibrionales bacterium]